jgi:thiol-disulfide isomerase/thioredoxin
MKRQFINQRLKVLVTWIKPWLTIIAVILVLRYTGLLSGLSFVTQSALLKTGLMDIDAKENVEPMKAFDYDFSVRDMDGNKVDMNDFKGKVIFLNLWATWCGPCRAEMPSIQKLYNKVDHEKIVFVMLSLDTEENKNKISRYVAEKEFTFPVYQPASPMPSQLRVSTIPTTFVIGSDGNIKLKNKGMADYSTDDFKNFLESL